MTERRFESGTGWLRMPEVGRAAGKRAPIRRLASSARPHFCLPAQLVSMVQSAVLAGNHGRTSTSQGCGRDLAFDEATWRNETSWDLARIGGLGAYGGNGLCTNAYSGETGGPGKVVLHPFLRRAHL